MKTISIFILLIYWSIMIFAPVMSKDVKFGRAKLNQTKIADYKTKKLIGRTTSTDIKNCSG